MNTPHSVQAGQIVYKICTILATVWIFLSAFAAEANSQSTAIEVKLITLENGLRVSLASIGNTQEAGFTFIVKQGYNPKNALLAHLMEHLVVSAATAANNGHTSSINLHNIKARTEQTSTKYSVSLRSEQLPEALEKFARSVTYNNYNEEQIQNELITIGQEFKYRSQSFHRRIKDAAFEVLDPDQTIYTRSRQDNQSVSPASILEFQRSNYTAANSYLAIIGSQKIDDLEALVRNTFRKLPRNSKVSATSLPQFRYRASRVDIKFNDSQPALIFLYSTKSLGKALQAYATQTIKASGLEESLIQDGLITRMESGVYADNGQDSIFSIIFILNDASADKTGAISSRLYSYLNALAKTEASKTQISVSPSNSSIATLPPTQIADMLAYRIVCCEHATARTDSINFEDITQQKNSSFWSSLTGDHSYLSINIENDFVKSSTVLATHYNNALPIPPIVLDTNIQLASNSYITSSYSPPSRAPSLGFNTPGFPAGRYWLRHSGKLRPAWKFQFQSTLCSAAALQDIAKIIKYRAVKAFGLKKQKAILIEPTGSSLEISYFGSLPHDLLADASLLASVLQQPVTKQEFAAISRSPTPQIRSTNDQLTRAKSLLDHECGDAVTRNDDHSLLKDWPSWLNSTTATGVAVGDISVSSAKAIPQNLGIETLLKSPPLNPPVTKISHSLKSSDPTNAPTNSYFAYFSTADATPQEIASQIVLSKPLKDFSFKEFRIEKRAAYKVSSGWAHRSGRYGVYYSVFYTETDQPNSFAASPELKSSFRSYISSLSDDMIKSYKWQALKDLNKFEKTPNGLLLSTWSQAPLAIRQPAYFYEVDRYIESITREDLLNTWQDLISKPSITIESRATPD